MRVANQYAFTLIAPLDDAEQVRLTLEQEPPDALAKIPTLHQARFVVVDQAPARLIFTAHHDGSPRLFEDQLLGTEDRVVALASLFEHCTGFDEEEGPVRVRVGNYIRKLRGRRSIPRLRGTDAHAFFVGARGRTVQRIREERQVCELAREQLDAIPDDERPHDVLRLRDVLKQRVKQEMRRARPTWEPLVGTGAPGRRDALRYWLRFGRNVGFAGVAFYAIFFVVPVGILTALGSILVIALVRNDEQAHAEALARAEAAETDSVAAKEEEDRYRALEAREDWSSQNELTAVTSLRPGRLRLALLHAVLWFVHQRASFQFTRGLLHGVPTIHFAHWLIFDRGRRLVFVSHYDGSFPSYLDDFVARAGKGLNAIWGGCVDFPAPRYLVYDGAKDAPRFKAFARRHQFAAQWFYSAYPNVSTEEVNRNSEISDGLWKRRMPRDQARAWLARI